jgi:hypothetical protein
MLRACASKQRHGLLRGGQDVRDRRVHDHHAEFGGFRHVDVIQSDAGASDHDHVRSPLRRVSGVDVGSPNG